jgi:hypothetical protein
VEASKISMGYDMSEVDMVNVQARRPALFSSPFLPSNASFLSPPLFLFLSRVLTHSPTAFPLTFHC